MTDKCRKLWVTSYHECLCSYLEYYEYTIGNNASIKFLKKLKAFKNITICSIDPIAFSHFDCLLKEDEGLV